MEFTLEGIKREMERIVEEAKNHDRVRVIGYATICFDWDIDEREARRIRHSVKRAIQSCRRG
ncbi:hypothetical protein [Modicisalibacter coralii]|uniref:hypothetical protein n=1 Tax=Modicisalibacter coralii TaxID=2304602 RepID=UPI00100BCCB3|nr:hypothetical protein [Halomonas coralii]